jgi:hypothetical protein
MNPFFGRIGDVWKHLLLMEVVDSLRPVYYFESHAGSAFYPLTRSPDRDFGVFAFLDAAADSPSLANSRYHSLLRALPRDDAGEPTSCPGSSALVMMVLPTSARYELWDTDEESVRDLREAARSLGVYRDVAILGDGLDGVEDQTMSLSDDDRRRARRDRSVRPVRGVGTARHEQRRRRRERRLAWRPSLLLVRLRRRVGAWVGLVGLRRPSGIRRRRVGRRDRPRDGGCARTLSGRDARLRSPMRELPVRRSRHASGRGELRRSVQTEAPCALRRSRASVRRICLRRRTTRRSRRVFGPVRPTIRRSVPCSRRPCEGASRAGRPCGRLSSRATNSSRAGTGRARGAPRRGSSRGHLESRL